LFFYSPTTCRVSADKIVATVTSSPMTPYTSASHFHPPFTIDEGTTKQKHPKRHPESQRNPQYPNHEELRHLCLYSSSLVCFCPLSGPSHYCPMISPPFVSVSHDTNAPRYMPTARHRRIPPRRARWRRISLGGHMALRSSGVVISSHSQLM